MSERLPQWARDGASDGGTPQGGQGKRAMLNPAMLPPEYELVYRVYEEYIETVATPERTRFEALINWQDVQIARVMIADLTRQRDLAVLRTQSLLYELNESRRELQQLGARFDELAKEVDELTGGDDDGTPI